MSESSSAPPVALVTTRPDAEIAAELREEAKPILEQLCEVQAKAMRAGFHIGFQIGVDQFGRSVVQAIQITKPL